MPKGVWYIPTIAPKYNFLIFSLNKLNGRVDTVFGHEPCSGGCYPATLSFQVLQIKFNYLWGLDLRVSLCSLLSTAVAPGGTQPCVTLVQSAVSHSKYQFFIPVLYACMCMLFDIVRTALGQHFACIPWSIVFNPFYLCLSWPPKIS